MKRTPAQKSFKFMYHDLESPLELIARSKTVAELLKDGAKHFYYDEGVVNILWKYFGERYSARHPLPQSLDLMDYHQADRFATHLREQAVEAYLGIQDIFEPPVDYDSVKV